MDVRLKICRDRGISKRLAERRLLKSLTKSLKPHSFNLGNHYRFQGKKRKAGLKEGGKDRPFSARPCGLAIGTSRLAPVGSRGSFRLARHSPSGGSNQAQSIDKNAHACYIWGNKYAVGAEYIPPL